MRLSDKVAKVGGGDVAVEAVEEVNETIAEGVALAADSSLVGEHWEVPSRLSESEKTEHWSSSLVRYDGMDNFAGSWAGLVLTSSSGAR